MKLKAFESKGASVMAFADYLEKLEEQAEQKHVNILRKAGANMLKSGYQFNTLERGQFGVAYNMDDGVFQINLPFDAKDLSSVMNDDIGVWDATGNKTGSFYRATWAKLQTIDLKKMREMHLEHVRLEQAVKKEFL